MQNRGKTSGHKQDPVGAGVQHNAEAENQETIACQTADQLANRIQLVIQKGESNIVVLSGRMGSGQEQAPDQTGQAQLIAGIDRGLENVTGNNVHNERAETNQKRHDRHNDFNEVQQSQTNLF